MFFHYVLATSVYLTVLSYCFQHCQNPLLTRFFKHAAIVSLVLLSFFPLTCSCLRLYVSKLTYPFYTLSPLLDATGVTPHRGLHLALLDE